MAGIIITYHLALKLDRQKDDYQSEISWTKDVLLKLILAIIIQTTITLGST